MRIFLYDYNKAKNSCLNELFWRTVECKHLKSTQSLTDWLMMNSFHRKDYPRKIQNRTKITCGWHGGAVGSTAASQLLSSGYCLYGVSHALPLSTWVSSRVSGFLPTLKWVCECVCMWPSMDWSLTESVFQPHTQCFPKIQHVHDQEIAVTNDEWMNDSCALQF